MSSTDLRMVDISDGSLVCVIDGDCDLVPVRGDIWLHPNSDTDDYFAYEVMGEVLRGAGLPLHQRLMKGKGDYTHYIAKATLLVKKLDEVPTWAHY